jgi:hypothetical protein
VEYPLFGQLGNAVHPTGTFAWREDSAKMDLSASNQVGLVIRNMQHLNFDSPV